MHRSGTSCLAGSLEEAGVQLGDVARIGTHNPKGNHESSRIMALQEDILSYSGGSWDRPPQQVKWSQAHREERGSIIRSHEGVPVWGFKDPRTLLLMDFWREALSGMQIVGTFRHPRHVAESLLRRGGGAIEDWIALWAHYNEQLLALYQLSPFPIVRFDLGENVYRRSLAIVMDRIGLVAPASLAFFDPALRHHETVPAGQLPENVGRLYDALCRAALNPGTDSGSQSAVLD